MTSPKYPAADNSVAARSGAAALSLEEVQAEIARLVEEYKRLNDRSWAITGVTRVDASRDVDGFASSSCRPPYFTPCCTALPSSVSDIADMICKPPATPFSRLIPAEELEFQEVCSSCVREFVDFYLSSTVAPLVSNWAKNPPQPKGWMHSLLSHASGYFCFGGTSAWRKEIKIFLREEACLMMRRSDGFDSVREILIHVKTLLLFVREELDRIQLEASKGKVTPAVKRKRFYLQLPLLRLRQNGRRVEDVGDTATSVGPKKERAIHDISLHHDIKGSNVCKSCNFPDDGADVTASLTAMDANVELLASFCALKVFHDGYYQFVNLFCAQFLFRGSDRWVVQKAVDDALSAVAPSLRRRMDLVQKSLRESAYRQ